MNIEHNPKIPRVIGIYGSVLEKLIFWTRVLDTKLGQVGESSW